MTIRRVVLVSRRYFPLVGGAETNMARLAGELARRGIDVTVLTVRWSKDWPATTSTQGFKVVRLPQPAVRWWGTWRYMQALGEWLAEPANAPDVVYVSMFKHDAYSALAARDRFPVVLRAEGGGRTGDMYWQIEAPFGRRIKRRCQRADAFVGPSPAVEREIVAAGYARDRICYIPNGVPIAAERATAADRQRARANLASAGPALELPEHAKLVVYTGRLSAEKGLPDLIAAWPKVEERMPAARLWLAGEGPLARELTQQIDDLGLGGRVVLAGAFTAVDELLAAADLFVLPSREEGMSLALLEAMAAGQPIVASDIAANRALIEHGQHGLLASPQDATTWSESIVRLLGDRQLADQLSAAAYERAGREFSLERMVDAHLELFEKVRQRFERGRS